MVVDASAYLALNKISLISHIALSCTYPTREFSHALCYFITESRRLRNSSSKLLVSFFRFFDSEAEGHADADDWCPTDDWDAQTDAGWEGLCPSSDKVVCSRLSGSFWSLDWLPALTSTTFIASTEDGRLLEVLKLNEFKYHLLCVLIAYLVQKQILTSNMLTFCKISTGLAIASMPTKARMVQLMRLPQKLASFSVHFFSLHTCLSSS